MAEASIHRSQQIKVRIQKLLARLEAGEDLTRIVETEGPPGIPDLITANIEALHDVGATLRRAEAAALESLRPYDGADRRPLRRQPSAHLRLAQGQNGPDRSRA